ncbi:hypothetical protein [Loigolactobacillus bifermentans]|uniref:Uncharacterized protein n=1 Tax=Loigolactobacillus bifermentans DSM 20003 TaxID=1423726 RepID=A0A0R1H211_9LACO|nr:hypothetical protein [Loigolactobacillus bifermentans]KRK40296.1 hypothetical protein FC07_GL001010 [Loigolactobacillus bifermentans DSM 20003]QGG59995.1 hypothetical protein LB003_05710 [Loigolactobacillus bifermentans]
MASFHFELPASKINHPTDPAQSEQPFENIFDFPDFVEMRPKLRDAVRAVAQEHFDQPVLPVEVQHLAVALENQLEQETRKYLAQGHVFENQKTELHELCRLYTRVLQIVSQTETVDADLEDLVFALNQTRLGLRNLKEVSGSGPQYDPEQQRHIQPGTFYDYVIQYLVQPYVIAADQPLTLHNLTTAGQQLAQRLAAYAFRDWDAYLTHRYDAEHLVKNQKGISDRDYYEALKQIELNYADHIYADVFGATFEAFEKLLVPASLPELLIQSTVLPAAVQHEPLRTQLTERIKRYFLLDATGHEHVLDQPLAEIQRKYTFYEANFCE